MSRRIRSSSRWAATPPWADPETLRWVAQQLRREQQRYDKLARAAKAPRRDGAISIERGRADSLYAMGDLACGIALQLERRAERQERKRAKRDRALRVEHARAFAQGGAIELKNAEIKP